MQARRPNAMNIGEWMRKKYKLDVDCDRVLKAVEWAEKKVRYRAELTLTPKLAATFRDLMAGSDGADGWSFPGIASEDLNRLRALHGRFRQAVLLYHRLDTMLFDVLLRLAVADLPESDLEAVVAEADLAEPYSEDTAAEHALPQSDTEAVVELARNLREHLPEVDQRLADPERVTEVLAMPAARRKVAEELCKVDPWTHTVRPVLEERWKLLSAVGQPYESAAVQERKMVGAGLEPGRPHDEDTLRRAAFAYRLRQDVWEQTQAELDRPRRYCLSEETETRCARPWPHAAIILAAIQHGVIPRNEVRAWLCAPLGSEPTIRVAEHEYSARLSVQSLGRLRKELHRKRSLLEPLEQRSPPGGSE